eukprot:gnl/MRDRNA2_/MRDRNA2_140516_c0_seq1.p1 gnl/MRDRNA2_/MRDRNA2_140516_c0~~gnl/MRDRNA2_/MRDRNA2_140516_c0_seq1.p1  ORF type:complete len:221 (+),score=55.05 gnl/MRDRNA2_/MRDRNA2_140516_c0_seq1:58-663(+)
MFRAQALYQVGYSLQEDAKTVNHKATVEACFFWGFFALGHLIWILGGVSLIHGALLHERRDFFMNNSFHPVEEASSLLHRAFKLVPSEVRQKYPDHTKDLIFQTNVELKRKKKRFLSTSLGSLSNVIVAAKKINHNKDGIQSCQQKLGQQLMTIRELIGLISAEEREAESLLAPHLEEEVLQLEQQVKDEEDRIFEEQLRT